MGLSVLTLSCERLACVAVSPLGACVACLAGRFRLWCDALSLAGCAAISWVEGKGRFRGWCRGFVEC